MGTEIRGVDILQPNHHAIPTITHANAMGPNVIDFVIDDGRLYWSDVTLSEIRTAGLSNGLISTILDTDLENVSGFAVDWISSNVSVDVRIRFEISVNCWFHFQMYVSTESNANSMILACNLKGEFVTEIHKDLLAVLSIVLDPVQGKMYWSHKKDLTKTYLIERSALDGSNREIVVNCTHPPESLTMEYSTRRLYFAYGSIGSILYVDLTTSAVQELVTNSDYVITSLTLYRESVYFAESNFNTIRKCDKRNCTDSAVLRNTTAAVKDLKMYHPKAQIGTNACSGSKNNCQHLCFATSTSHFVCRCAIGYAADPMNPNNCIGEKELLLYSLGHELKGLRLNETTPQLSGQVLGPIPRISQASWIDYHFEKDLIFWADNDKGTVSSIKRDGTNRNILLRKFEQQESGTSDWSGGIAVDWVADNIYVSATINVTHSICFMFFFCSLPDSR